MHTGVAMSKFLLVYHGGGDGAPTDEEMALWGAWFEQLGAAVVDGGAPIAETKTLSSDGASDGGGVNPASGYSIIEASDMDDAVAKAGAAALVTGGAGGIDHVEQAIAIAVGAHFF